jgi:hypothetical protein
MTQAIRLDPTNEGRPTPEGGNPWQFSTKIGPRSKCFCA